MSHYAVLVIGENVEGQLAPFDENIEMPKYEDGAVTIEEKKSFLETYTIPNKDTNYGVDNEEQSRTNRKLTFEDLYKKYGKDWNGGCWRKHTDGEWFNYSTYNPKSKWDWFEVGGRWDGMLKLKDGGRECNASVKGDVDFSRDEEEYKKAERFWELYVDGEEPKNDKEKKIIEYTFHKKEYYIDRYKNKKTYAKTQSEFSTFAVLKDGEWFEAGEMGWFGCSSATSQEETEWDKSFYDKFIKDLDDDTLLTVVDCHI